MARTRTSAERTPRRSFARFKQAWAAKRKEWSRERRWRKQHSSWSDRISRAVAGIAIVMAASYIVIRILGWIRFFSV